MKLHHLLLVPLVAACAETASPTASTTAATLPPSGYVQALPCDARDHCSHHPISQDLVAPFRSVEELTVDSAQASIRLAVQTSRGWTIVELPKYNGPTTRVPWAQDVGFALMAEDAPRTLDVKVTLARPRDTVAACAGDDCESAAEIQTRWRCTEDATKVTCAEHPYADEKR